MYARISRTCLLSATKLRRLCFYMCLSFSPQGGSASVHAGIPPPRDQATPPPRDQTSPGRDPLGPDTTPIADTPRSRHHPGPAPLPQDGCRCGRYASYWNAILFIEFLLHICLVYLLPNLPSNITGNILHILFATS